MAESNEQSAIDVYMVAVAYHDNVDLNQVDNPGRDRVEEVEQDVYRILPREERGEVTSPLAICAYIPEEDHWIVELRPEDEKYVVVWREETYQVWEGTPD